ncbi:hypothetical protein PC122_g239 [Phytophthora cactorum]|nr:hypothetical protein PC122_g239 [Phytophthora cactorum]
MTGIQHTRPALEAEMNLLHELQATGQLHVQTPVRNTSGEWVTAWLDEAGEEICSTVLEWIEGRDIKQGERLTTAQIHDLGVQLQTLHQYGRRPEEAPKPQVGSQKSESGLQVNDHEQHADKAIIPEIYTDSPALDPTGVRPAYGSIKENLVMLEQLEEGVRRGIFTPEDFDLIRETFENINRQLETYPHTAETWGVIHADITRGNLLVTNQGISMIDFCLYGYGYYLFDAGGAALIFNREERDAFLSGYTEQTGPLAKRDIRRKSCYVVGIYALFQIILVIGMSLDAQEVVFIRQVMNLPESQYGALMSITGIGYLAGSMLVWLFAKHLPIRHMMGGGVLLVALGYFLFARSFSFELAAFAFILLGLCSALANTGLVTFYQNNIPVDLMGRMSSILGLVLSVLQVVSILVAGVVAEQLSLRMVYTVVSGVMVLAALGLWMTSMFPSRSRYYDEPAKPKAVVG